MRWLHKLAVAAAVAAVAMAGGTLVAQADSTPTVYDTPGGQISGGRLWNTTCEKYSTNVVRCRANIWATQVQYRNGRYVKTTGWTFNNLSYLPSPRASWAGNNLGQNNPRWASGGRTWKTECDTATTGRGGCRSYVWTKKVIAVKSGSGYVYRNNEQWVFNNLVLFSSASVPAVSEVPPWIIDQSRLSGTGLGPLQVGTSVRDLLRLGYLVDPGDICLEESQSLRNRGIDIRNTETAVTDLLIYKNEVWTVDGARVGMTLGEIKGIYGDRLRLEDKGSPIDDETIPVAVVQRAGHELVFFDKRDEYTRGLEDSDVIDWIVARPISDEFYYDGC